MSLLFNTLSRFVIAFLPRSKRLLISWLQSASAEILESPKIKSVTVSIVSPSICHEVIGRDAMIWGFWMLSFKPAFPLSYFTYIKKLLVSMKLVSICLSFWDQNWQLVEMVHIFNRRRKIPTILLCIWKCPMWGCLSENNPFIPKWRKLLHYWNIVEMNI